MKKFIEALTNSPTGFITGIVRSDLGLNDVQNIERTYGGSSDTKYNYDAINFVFEATGELLGNLKIPLTETTYDNGLMRSEGAVHTQQCAKHGSLVLNLNPSDTDSLPTYKIEISFDLTPNIGTFKAWSTEFAFN